MQQQQVEKDILDWMKNFVEVPHPALGGWPPCPYARAARLANEHDIRLGTTPTADLITVGENWPEDKKIVIFVYNAQAWPHKEFHDSVMRANQELLLERDIIALEDHPSDVELVRGVCMNQGLYALIMCQRLGELNSRAIALAGQGYYHDWPQDYLENLFQHRNNPLK